MMLHLASLLGTITFTIISILYYLVTGEEIGGWLGLSCAVLAFLVYLNLISSLKKDS